MGGFLHTRNATELPHNTKQFSNLRLTGSNSTKLLSVVSVAKDGLIAVIEKCKATSGMCNKQGKQCLFHGPMFIHQRKQYESYHQFASRLARLQPSLKNLKAFGTDGEQALYIAFHSVFPDADHLQCTVHLKRKIKEKLKLWKLLGMLS